MIKTSWTKLLFFLVALCVALAVTPQSKPPRTIRGTVFEDANGNGQRDAGERGVAGVALSDQTGVVTTGADGSFQLEAAPSAGVVSVSLPDGWGAVGKFWRPLADTAGEQRVDFTLHRRATATEFIFVHASDTHVSAASLPRLQRMREMVEKLHPAFVLLTGDLVKDALRVPESEARGYYEMVVAELGKFSMPVWTVPGNHENFGIERSKSKVNADHPFYGKKMYRYYLGSNYYSFTWGGVHFVGLDSVDIVADANDDWYYGHIDATQLAWLTRDLAGAAASSPVVTFNHIPMATAVEQMGGYMEGGPAPSLIRINGKMQYRHIVSNTADVLDALRPLRLEIALGGHMHVRESLVYETESGPVRFQQSAAIVDSSKVAGMTTASGFTVYRVKNGKIDNGTFISLDK
ncbi:MAG TPA: metallophosphoesterase [Candidatus Acidoferrales bacterium]|nr:metallophosphoesterase [Candidatus Acidoferrales bacterium]